MSGEISLKMGKKEVKLTSGGCKAAGVCSNLADVNTTSSISLTCNGIENADPISVKITFTGGDVWYMSALKAHIDGHDGADKYKLDGNDKLFQASRNNSYTCADDHSLKLGKSNITVDFKKFNVQPFAGADIKAVACPSGVSPNPDSSIVPIAVGCALAGLIVIVLIAYLIGRRKGGNRGYQKV